MAKKSVTTGSRDASANRPMTIGEIATIVAKKKARALPKVAQAVVYREIPYAINREDNSNNREIF
jgi:hypothetical protein